MLDNKRGAEDTPVPLRHSLLTDVGVDLLGFRTADQTEDELATASGIHPRTGKSSENLEIA